MLDIPAITQALDNQDAQALANIIRSGQLELRDGKLYASSPDVKATYEYWDKRQLVKKILLNSAYGALLNQHCRFWDKRIGQSVTLTGRQIVRHMMSKISEYTVGEYNHDTPAIIYGDSVTGDTVIRTDQGEMTIQELFDQCAQVRVQNDREYGTHCDREVQGFNAYTMEPQWSQIDYVMRHHTDKTMYRVHADTGQSVTVTEDHSLIVDRDGFLVECSPGQLQDNDLVIIQPSADPANTTWTRISKTECLGNMDDYVYDISIKHLDPFFFANDILVHNTDSSFFTAYPMLKPDIDAGKLTWNKEVCVQLYDSIAEQVNASFPAFMERAFHAPREKGQIISAGRELVGDRGIFITKKRYAINIYDKEGKRLDQGGRQGKIKAMGLDLKRADTPKQVQDFLMSVLEFVLAGGDRDTVVDMIKEFKAKLSAQPSWTKGTPKSVNKLTSYGERELAKGKSAMPGHVRAALNWNSLRQANGDNYSQKIVDGMKIVVCKLKPNPLGWTSMAYPIDELHLPEWFRELPFDDKEMEAVLVDGKIDNLLGVLDWDLYTDTNMTNTFQDLFTFE